MDHEIGRGHEPGKDERDCTGEEAERNNAPPTSSIAPVNSKSPCGILSRPDRTGKFKSLPFSMLHEKQSDHDPEDRLQLLATKTQV